MCSFLAALKGPEKKPSEKTCSLASLTLIVLFVPACLPFCKLYQQSFELPSFILYPDPFYMRSVFSSKAHTFQIYRDLQNVPLDFAQGFPHSSEFCYRTVRLRDQRQYCRPRYNNEHRPPQEGYHTLFLRINPVQEMQ